MAILSGVESIFPYIEGRPELARLYLEIREAAWRVIFLAEEFDKYWLPEWSVVWEGRMRRLVDENAPKREEIRSKKREMECNVIILLDKLKKFFDILPGGLSAVRGATAGVSGGRWR